MASINDIDFIDISSNQLENSKKVIILCVFQRSLSISSLILVQVLTRVLVLNVLTIHDSFL